MQIEGGDFEKLAKMQPLEAAVFCDVEMEKLIPNLSKLPQNARAEFSKYGEKIVQILPETAFSGPQAIEAIMLFPILARHPNFDGQSVSKDSVKQFFNYVREQDYPENLMRAFLFLKPYMDEEITSFILDWISNTEHSHHFSIKLASGFAHNWLQGEDREYFLRLVKENWGDYPFRVIPLLSIENNEQRQESLRNEMQKIMTETVSEVFVPQQKIWSHP
jgi:hypothetical protein